MKKVYSAISAKKAYKLLNSGALLVVCSSDSDKKHNLAPVAWHCPVDYDPVTRCLFVCSKEHKTFKNILHTGKYVLCIPHANQLKTIEKLGNCSGFKYDKIKKFKIEVFLSKKYKISVLAGCVAYLECKLERVILEKYVGILIGKVESAMVDKSAFNDRLLSEKSSAKTLHHLGGQVFFVPPDKVLKPNSK